MSTIVLAVLGIIGMVAAMVVVALEEDKKEVTVEQELTKQATKIASVIAQLDRLNGKVGR